MSTRYRAALRLAPCAAALALAVALPGRAAAQEPAQAPAATAQAIKDVPLTAAQRQRFAGSYTLTTPDGQEMPFRVYEENGKLMGQPGDEEPKRLMYQGDNVFRPEGIPDFSLTFTVEGGQVKKFSAHKGGDAVGEGVRKP